MNDLKKLFFFASISAAVAIDTCRTHKIGSKMSRFAMHPNSERPIFCPKPRRLSQLSIPAATDLDGCRLRPTPFDTIAGAELLDIFLSKVFFLFYFMEKVSCRWINNLRP